GADGRDRRRQARPLSALLHLGGSQPAERPRLGLLRLAEPAPLHRAERLLADLRGRPDPGQHRAPDGDAAGAARGVRGRRAAGVPGRRGCARRLLARAGEPRPARGRGARERARRGARPQPVRPGSHRLPHRARRRGIALHLAGHARTDPARRRAPAGRALQGGRWWVGSCFGQRIIMIVSTKDRNGLENKKEEEEHLDRLAERIDQLGGKPNLNPDGVGSRAASEYAEGENLVDMIKEDLVAERVAIETYREMVRYFGDRDPTTRVLLERILAQEEEHANDMHDLLVTHEGRPMLEK